MTPSFPELASWAPIRPTPLFRTFWEFAAERHRVYLKRLRGLEAPWTDDPILRAYRFTNVYRASDRVSQYLIRTVIPGGSQAREDVLLRVLLFKIFNKIETWETIVDHVGWPDAESFDVGEIGDVLSDCRASGRPVYSGAYIMPMPPGFNYREKHRCHLALIREMLTSGLAERLRRATSLRGVFRELRAYPSIGGFLAFQLAIDLNYSTVISFDEADFVVAGPGALDGLSKCFSETGGLSPDEVIGVVCDRQAEAFSQLGLSFEGLFGRALQPIDVQNLFCEVSKYTRASHPEVPGRLGRTRIKQTFTSNGELDHPRFPADWGINDSVAATLGTRS